MTKRKKHFRSLNSADKNRKEGYYNMLNRGKDKSRNRIPQKIIPPYWYSRVAMEWNLLGVNLVRGIRKITYIG